MRTLLLSFSLWLGACASGPLPAPTPPGEADYCQRHPEAPVCEPFSSK